MTSPRPIAPGLWALVQDFRRRRHVTWERVAQVNSLTGHYHDRAPVARPAAGRAGFFHWPTYPPPQLETAGNAYLTVPANHA
jgi:hypothetical protein